MSTGKSARRREWVRCRPMMVLSLIAATVVSVLQAQPASVLSVAGRSNDAVRLASDGNFVVAVWGASMTGGMDVFSAVSRDGGATFSAPVRVNATAFDARVGGEQPPLVSLSARRGAPPVISVVWNARRPEGGRLMTAASQDGGVTFGETTVVPGSAANGNRGWASMAATPSGRVHVLWLDHRSVPPATHAHGAVASGPAAPPRDPVEQASFSKLYSASLDGAAPPQVITGSVCYCCKTSFVSGADGTLYGVWRHVFPGDFRDMALTISRNGGRSFTAPLRVSEDHWEFDGCPDNGPALAVDGAKRVHVVWPTPADGKNPNAMALFYAQSRDGAAFSPRVKLPTDGPAGHVNVTALRTGELVVTWEELTGGARTVKVARGMPDASGRVTFRTAATPAAGKYPAVVETPSGALVAWTQSQNGTNSIALQRIPR
jgi:hypothetical protein